MVELISALVLLSKGPTLFICAIWINHNSAFKCIILQSTETSMLLRYRITKLGSLGGNIRCLSLVLV